MPQVAYQDAINAIALLAYAAQAHAMFLAAVYAIVIHANAIRHAIMYVIMTAKSKFKLYLFFFMG